MSKAYLKFKDVGGIETVTMLKDLVNTRAIGDVQSFAQAVKLITNAGIVEYGLIQPQFGTGLVDAGAPGTPGSSVKNKARCAFQYINANNEVKSIMLWIPAPDMAMFEYVEGVGYRMLALSGESIKDELVALTGIAGITFINGTLDYSEAENASHTDNAVEFVDYVGNRCWMSVPQPVSLATLATFADAITAESIAKVERYVYSQYNSVVVSGAMASPTTDENGFDSVERRARCRFRYIEGSRRKTMSMIVPAPLSTTLVNKKGKPGYSLATNTGDTLAIAVTALYGNTNRNVSFRNGKVHMAELVNQ